MKNICVVGTGYVGLVTGACLADLGHRVTCLDTDAAKVAALREGVLPIYEPGLDEIVHRNMSARRLSVTTDFGEGVPDADFILICVGTPVTASNDVDLSYMYLACQDISARLNGNKPIIVIKSTVPPGTSDMIASFQARGLSASPRPPVVSNPEFLREGHAVFDFMNPSRVVIGAQDPEVAEAVAELYRPLNSPLLVTDTRTAEMIKLASNAFLAMRISFINEMASISDRIGVDIEDVAQGIGLDPRISKDFLRAGPGYGGACLPKDVALLSRFSQTQGHDATLINAVIDVNQQQPRRLVGQLINMVGDLRSKTVGILGLAFKAHTDDVRHSPALALLREIRAEGARVRAYDPKAASNAQSLEPAVEYTDSPYLCAESCDALVIGTEWPEFRELDLMRLKAAMRGRVLLDCRNIIDPHKAQEAGLIYKGVGRGRTTSPRMAMAEPRVVLS